MMNTKKIKTFMVAMAVMMAASSVYFIEVEEPEPADGAFGFAAGLVIGFAIGFAFGISIGDPDDEGSQEEINAVLRQLEAEKVVMSSNSVNTFAGTVLPADTSLWGFTQYHWNRSAELAVADTWTLGRTYDANHVTERSTHRMNIENYLYDWQAALDNQYTWTLIKHMDKWSAYNHLRDMTAQLVWDGGYVDIQNGRMDWTQIVQNVDANATVYIDTSSDTHSGVYRQSTSGTMYKLSPGTVKLRSMVTGKMVTLSDQETDLSAVSYDGLSERMKPGLYRIETAGATLAGPISQAADQNAAEVKGALISVSASGLNWFTSDGDVTRVNSSSVTSKLALEIGYVDRNGADRTARSFIVGSGSGEDPMRMVSEWSRLVERINSTVREAAVCGDVMWSIFDTCQNNIPYLAPSSLVTTVDGVSLNAAQSKAIYMDGLMQIAAAYNTHGADLDRELKQTFTFDSLSLYVQGDIYYNGELYAAAAVFTPYSALAPQTFVPGQRTVWQNTGFAQIWGYGDIDGWSGPTNTSEYTPITFGTGYHIDVKAVGSNGQMLDSATISPSEVRRYTVDPGDTPSPSDTVTLSPSRTATIVAMVAIGLMLMFGSVYFRSMILGILGLVVLAAAYLVYSPPSIRDILPFMTAARGLR